MARIEIDPNYSSPTFSRATAATDLFKKEDVQGLAAAMSTHDHTAGKGLVLPAAAIPTGFITSAMILNGTIDTVDYKDATVTAAKLAGGAAVGNLLGGSLTRGYVGGAISGASSSSSASFVASGPDQMSWAPAAGATLLIATWTGAVQCSVKAALVQMYLGWGAGTTLQPLAFHAPDITYAVGMTLTAYVLLPVGTTTLQVYWSVSTGTVSMITNRTFTATEYLK